MTEFDWSLIDGEAMASVTINQEVSVPGRSTYSMKIEEVCSIVFCNNSAEGFLVIVSPSSRVKVPIYACFNHYGEVMEAAQSLGSPAVDHSTVSDILDIRDSIIGGG